MPTQAPWIGEANCWDVCVVLPCFAMIKNTKYEFKNQQA